MNAVEEIRLQARENFRRQLAGLVARESVGAVGESDPASRSLREVEGHDGDLRVEILRREEFVFRAPSANAGDLKRDGKLSSGMFGNVDVELDHGQSQASAQSKGQS